MRQLRLLRTKGQFPMLVRRLSALLCGLLVPAALSADNVYLKNGRSFEGVIAEVTDSTVKIHMPGGALTLPRSHVDRVEASEAGQAGYLKRKEALQRDPKARGADWLKLAQWAQSEGLEQGAREAALVAADMEPGLEGLAPILRRHRFVYDEQLDRWVSYEESMRRKGFVYANGAWITREEQADRNRQQEEMAARRRSEMEAARAERNARQTEALLATQIALLKESLQPSTPPPAQYAWPMVYVVPGYFPPVPHHPRHPDGPSEPGYQPEPRRPPVQNGHGSFTRVPGSLIPGTIGKH